MNILKRLFLFLGALTFAVCVRTLEAQTLDAPTLTHQYKFNEANVTTGGYALNSITSLTDAALKTYGAGANAQVGGGNLTLSGGTGNNTGYMELSGIDWTQYSNGVTFELWASQAELSLWARMIEVAKNNTNWFFYSTVSNQNNKSYLGMALNNVQACSYFDRTQSPMPIPNTFKHVAITLTKDNLASFYADGKMFAQVDVKNSLADLGSPSLYLGKSAYNDCHFNGSYDEFRIYNGVLSDAQIQQNTQYGTNSDIQSAPQFGEINSIIQSAKAYYNGSTSLIGNTKKASGADKTNRYLLADLSGNNNHLEVNGEYGDQITGSGKLTIGQLMPTGVRALNSDGYCIDHGNRNGHLILWEEGNSSLFDLNKSITVSARVQMGEYNGVDDFIRLGHTAITGGNNNGTTFGLGAINGMATFWLAGEGQNTTEIKTDYALATNQWFDITGVFDSEAKTASLYIYDPSSGALLFENTQDVGFDTLKTEWEGGYGPTNNNFMIFSSPSFAHGENVGGLMDYAGVWGYALSPDQVGLLASNGGGGVPEPSTWALLLLGVFGIALLRRRK